MPTLSTRALAALAFERGEEFDPALALSSALAEDLALVAGARPLQCEPSPADRRRQRERRQRCATKLSDAEDDLAAAARGGYRGRSRAA